MSTIFKHTPAPWAFDDIKFKIKGSGDIEGRTIIADVSPKMDYSRGMVTQVANARLIAAAPALLAACIEAEKHHQGGHSDIGFILRDAIKRATE